MNLSTIKQILAEREIRLTRSLGQNFLHDANQLAKIVSAAAVTKADTVLEIGPGLGPMTDLKLLFMYGLVFRKRFTIGLAVALFVGIGLVCVLLGGLSR